MTAPGFWSSITPIQQRVALVTIPGFWPSITPIQQKTVALVAAPLFRPSITQIHLDKSSPIHGKVFPGDTSNSYDISGPSPSSASSLLPSSKSRLQLHVSHRQPPSWVVSRLGSYKWSPQVRAPMATLGHDYYTTTTTIKPFSPKQVGVTTMVADQKLRCNYSHQLAPLFL
jgi:hypothetical protein